MKANGGRETPNWGWRSGLQRGDTEIGSENVLEPPSRQKGRENGEKGARAPSARSGGTHALRGRSTDLNPSGRFRRGGETQVGISGRLTVS